MAGEVSEVVVLEEVAAMKYEVEGVWLLVLVRIQELEEGIHPLGEPSKFSFQREPMTVNTSASEAV